MWNEHFANVKEKYISKPLTSLTQTIIELAKHLWGGISVGPSPDGVEGLISYQELRTETEEVRVVAFGCSSDVPSRRFGAGKGPDVVQVTDLDPPHW